MEEDLVQETVYRWYIKEQRNGFSERSEGGSKADSFSKKKSKIVLESDEKFAKVKVMKNR